MSENLFDEVMQSYASKAWMFEMLDAPKCGMKEDDDIESPLSMTEFQRVAGRAASEAKTTAMLFDVQRNLPESGSFAAIGRAAKDNKLEDLPAELRPQTGFPDDAKLGMILHNNQDGTYDALSVIHFKESVPTKSAMKLSKGNGFEPVFRHGPWAVKKALVALMARVPGYHVSWSKLTAAAGPAGMQRSQSQAWNPPNDELQLGVEFINKFAPECDSRNEQTFWLMKHIKVDSGSPIAGWPEHKARKMAENKSKGNAGAEV